MARIRSVKPEFFQDEDLAVEVPSRDARLLYIGLWGLADEHGRLRGNSTSIKGELFAYDDDLTPEVIDKLIGMLVDTGRAIRYQVRSSAYLFLPKLAKNQRLEPSKVPSRLPPPPAEQGQHNGANKSGNRADESAPDANKLPLKQVASGKWQVAGSKWQDARGSAARTAGRGSREEPPPESTGDPPGETERIVTAWITSLRKRPQAKIVNDIGKHVRAALAEGQDPADVAEALKLWQTKGTLGPAVLPSLIHQVATGSPPGDSLALPSARASPHRPSTTDARMRDGAAVTAHFEARQTRNRG